MTAEGAIAGFADCASANLVVVRVLNMSILVEVHRRRLISEMVEGVDLETVVEHWIRIRNH